MQETLRVQGEQIITKLLWPHNVFMMFLSSPVSSLSVNSALFVEVTRPTHFILIFLSALSSDITKNNQGVGACKSTFKQT